MTRISTAVAAALLAFGAAGPAAQTPDPCQFDTVCKLLDQNIGITAPVTLERLRAFAKVERERVTKIKNLHDPATTDEVHDFSYAGVTIKAYASAAGPVLLQQIVVTGGEHALPLRLAFGRSTLEDVENAIGPPKTVEHLPGGTSRWRYVNVEDTAWCAFEFAPEPSLRITRVEWHFEVD